MGEAFNLFIALRLRQALCSPRLRDTRLELTMLTCRLEYYHPPLTFKTWARLQAGEVFKLRASQLCKQQVIYGDYIHRSQYYPRSHAAKDKKLSMVSQAKFHHFWGGNPRGFGVIFLVG
jgi:hypothetical protein